MPSKHAVIGCKISCKTHWPIDICHTLQSPAQLLCSGGQQSTGILQSVQLIQNFMFNVLLEFMSDHELTDRLFAMISEYGQTDTLFTVMSAETCGVMCTAGLHHQPTG